MLEDKDRIFKNLYNDFGADLKSAKNRGDWINTKELFGKGKAQNDILKFKESAILITLVNFENEITSLSSFGLFFR